MNDARKSGGSLESKAAWSKTHLWSLLNDGKWMGVNTSEGSVYFTNSGVLVMHAVQESFKRA